MKLSLILKHRITMLALGLVVGFTTAGQSAFMVTDDGNGDILTSVNNITLGYQFAVGAKDVTVLSLGVWDNGTNGLNAAHPIGLWTVGGTLLASNTVPAGTGGTLLGEFRYITLATPVALTANTTYLIGALYGSSGATSEAYRDLYAGAPTHATPTFSSDFNTIIPGYGYNAEAYTLRVPNDQLFGSFVGDAYMGPSFQYIPEPSVLCLGLLGAGSLVLRLRSKRLA